MLFSLQHSAACAARKISWRQAATTCVFLVLLMMTGCGGEERTPGEERVGDLSDRSYYDARGKARPSASGKTVRFEQFEGRFVWADYTAPWCPYCADQAGALKQVKRSTADDVVFLTIMTSDLGGYGDPATQATAASWARAHGLDPSLVLAADLTATTVPRHILFSPEGQMLFLHSGFLPAERIRQVLEEQTAGWQAAR